MTVFSALNYCNQNGEAMMLVDENLICGFKILVPKMRNVTFNLFVYKKLIRNLTPPPKNRDVEEKGENEENKHKNINQNTNDEG